MILVSPAITIDAVDYADHVIAADVQAPSSVIDDRTFGAPYASDVASGNQSITLSCKWSDALMALLTTTAPNTAKTIIITPDTGGGTITASCKFANLPLGRFQIGEKAECEVVFAVVDDITWAAAA